MADPMTREKLRDLLSDMECGAGPDGGDIMAACDDLIAQERAEVERLRAELAAIRTTETDATWLADGVRRLILGVSVRTAKDASAAQYTIAQEVASHINAGVLTAFVSSRVVDLAVEYVRQAEAEQGRLAEQVQRVRDRHPHKTDDADCMDADTTLGCQHGPGYHVVEYCGTCDEEWPCAEIRALGGTEAGRPDPRQVALEQLAERYSEAFECLLYRNELEGR